MRMLNLYHTLLQHKRMLFWVIVGGMVMVVVSALLVWVISQTPYIQKRLLIEANKQLISLTGTHIRINRISTDLWSHVTVEGLTIKDTAFPDDSLYFRTVRLWYVLPDLLKRNPSIRSIRLNGGACRLSKAPDGSIGIINKLLTIPRGESKPTIKSISVLHTEIVLVDLASNQGLHLDDVNLRSRWAGSFDSGTFNIQTAHTSLLANDQCISLGGSSYAGHYSVKSAAIQIHSGEQRAKDMAIELKGRIPLAVNSPLQITLSARISPQGTRRFASIVPDLDNTGALALDIVGTGSLKQPHVQGHIQGKGLIWEKEVIDTFSVNFGATTTNLKATADIRSKIYGIFTGEAQLRYAVKQGHFEAGSYRVKGRLEDANITTSLQKMALATHPCLGIGSASFEVSGNSPLSLPNKAAFHARLSPTNAVLCPDSGIFIQGTLRDTYWQGTITHRTDRISVQGSLAANHDIIAMVQAELFEPGQILPLLTSDPSLAQMGGMIRINGGFSYKDHLFANARAQVAGHNLRWQGLYADSVTATMSYDGSIASIEEGRILLRGPLENIFSILHLKVPVSADVEGALHFKGPVQNPLFTGVVHGSRLRNNGQTWLDTLTSTIAVSADSINLSGLESSKGTTSVTGNISWGFGKTMNLKSNLVLTSAQKKGLLQVDGLITTDVIDLNASLSQVEASALLPWLGPSKPFSGLCSGQLQLFGAVANPTIDLKGTITDPTYSKYAARSVQIHALVQDSTVIVDASVLVGDAPSQIGIKGKLRLLPSHGWRPDSLYPEALLTFATEKLNLGSLQSYLPQNYWAGGGVKASVEILPIDGVWSCRGNAWLSGGSLKVLPRNIVMQDIYANATLNGPIKSPRVGIEAMTGAIQDPDGTLARAFIGIQCNLDSLVVDSLVLICADSGLARVAGVMRYQIDSTIALQYPIKGGFLFDRIPLVFFNRLIPRLTIEKGSLSGQGVIVVDKTRMYLDGELALLEGVAAIEGIKQQLGPLACSLTMSNDTLRIKKFTGKIGKGDVEGHGYLMLSGKGVTVADLVLGARDLQINYGDDLQTMIQTAQLRLMGSGDNLLLKGNLVAGRSRYQQPMRISQLLSKLRNGNLSLPTKHESDWVAKTSVDVRLSAEPVIAVDLGMANVTAGADLAIKGTIGAPSYAGTIFLTEGSVFYLDRKFSLTKGFFRMVDPTRFNPELSLEAQTTLAPKAGTRSATRYQVFLSVQGTLERPEVILRGVADNQRRDELSKADIVSLLTLGRVRDNTGEAIQLEGQSDFTNMLIGRAQAMASQQITGYATRRLERFLQLDDVTLDGNLFNYDQKSGPRLRISKSIRDRIQLSYQGVIGNTNDQSVRISYKLSPILFLDGETNAQSSAGLDLRWRVSF